MIKIYKGLDRSIDEIMGRTGTEKSNVEDIVSDIIENVKKNGD